MDPLVATAEPGLVIVYPRDDDWSEGCVCECCPCNMHGCPVCTFAAPDSGPFGFRAPMVRGGSALPVVTQDITRGRSRFGHTKAIRDTKRDAHRRHRRSWKAWLHRGAPDEYVPSPKPGTGWEVW